MKQLLIGVRIVLLFTTLSALLTGAVAWGATPPPPAASSTPPAASVPAPFTAGSSIPKAGLLPADSYVLLRLSDVVQLGASGGEKEDGAKGGLSSVAALLTAVLAPLAWPISVGVIVWLLLRAPAIQILLNKIPRHVTQLNVAGLEIKLSPGAEATLTDLEKLVHQVPDTHRDWVANSYLQPQFQQLVSNIKSYLTDTAQCDSGKPLSDAKFGSFRFTLHVPDVLLEHSFRQLLDYTGRSRGGSGRVFSMRIGIIGKAWRMERSEYVPDNTYTEDELVELWGMTRAEARDTSSGSKEYLAVLIRSDQGLPLAILYADSPGSTLFDVGRYQGAVSSQEEVFEHLEQRIKDASKTCGLTESLRLLDEQRRRVRQLDIYSVRDRR